MSFGAELRRAREGLGLELTEVAARTKIRRDYLQALEEETLSALPERAFSRSYLQRYARELQLDAAPLLVAFDRAMPLSPEIAQGLRGGNPARRPPARPRSAAPLAVLLTGLVLLGAGGYYALHTWRGAADPAPAQATTQPDTPAAAPATPEPRPAEQAPAPAPERTVPLSVSSVPSGARVTLDGRDLGLTPLRSYPVQAGREAELRVALDGREPLAVTVQLDRGRNLRAQLSPRGKPSTLTDLNNPAPKPAPAPAPKPAAGQPAAASPVRVTFTGQSWTRVTDAGGRVLYEGTPPAGSVKGFPRGVTVRAGNAGAVQVSVNGAAAEPIGQTGQVVSRTY